LHDGAADAHRPGPSPLIVLGVAFFLSGASALVYQVAWQRILALHTGVGIQSVAVIVASFMAGLGLGSYVGGRWSLVLPANRSLLCFGGLELALAAWGASSAWIYYDLLYTRYVHFYRGPLPAAFLHLASLILPTTLMGMSLPLLVRGSVRSVGAAGRTIGLLYGLNVLGASAGALVTPWLLVRFLGVRGALLAAALGNAAAGLSALWAAGRRRPRDREDAPALARDGAGPRAGDVMSHEASAPAIDGPRPPMALWLGLYALAGFCALALELVWFRLVEVAVKSTAFTFGTVLSLYLLGSGLGSVFMASQVQRLRRPLPVFLAFQCLLLIYAGAALVLLARLPADTPGFQSVVRFWQHASSGFVLPGTRDFGLLLTLYGVIPVVLFGPPTLLMGASFPVLHRAVQNDARTSGHKAGALQGANIAGCVLGSLGLGFLGLNFLGTAGTFRLLMVVGLTFVLVGLRHGSPRLFAGMGGALLLLAFVLPSQESLWRRLHGIADTSGLLDEDATGVAALVPQGPGRWHVLFGGKYHSWIPYGSVHSRLGAIPAIVHPEPQDIAIIGLGSGDSAWAAGCRPQTRSLTVFELSAMQPRLLRRLAAEAELPELRALLADSRLRIEPGDGRNALATGTDRYDIIEADALWPTAAYSGNLYSEQFFSLCARRLKPGGIMCTWAPTPRVAAGFSRVFPHVVAVENGRILLGSQERLPLARADWREMLVQGPVMAYLGETLARDVLERLRLARRPNRAPGGESNDDLFPRDEFATPAVR
jgi:spermidine synthase